MYVSDLRSTTPSLETVNNLRQVLDGAWSFSSEFQSGSGLSSRQKGPATTF
ncbi:hypothetical protein F2Q68_00011347 [Brassica cretica]|uniref:Uncharacterized protein n=1 Tax=Brassica cretica TaxID=69181 RepID=A0A8S9L1G2_BRACR|nr:hypothetical protein F2Q68_00011347 [Brassica cretica]